MKKIILTSIISLVLFSQTLLAVNVNTANVTTLASQLNGVGIKKAQAIVDYREENGRFKSPDSLIRVKGIGMTTVEKNRDIIKITGK